MRVVVQGLTAQPQLNGQLGTLVEWVDEEGSWRVVMDECIGKMLKPLNLEHCPDAPPAPEPAAAAALNEIGKAAPLQTSPSLPHTLWGARRQGSNLTLDS